MSPLKQWTRLMGSVALLTLSGISSVRAEPVTTAIAVISVTQGVLGFGRTKANPTSEYIVGTFATVQHLHSRLSAIENAMVKSHREILSDLAKIRGKIDNLPLDVAVPDLEGATNSVRETLQVYLARLQRYGELSQLTIEGRQSLRSAIDELRHQRNRMVATPQAGSRVSALAIGMLIELEAVRVAGLFRPDEIRASTRLFDEQLAKLMSDENVGSVGYALSEARKHLSDLEVAIAQQVMGSNGPLKPGTYVWFNYARQHQVWVQWWCDDPYREMNRDPTRIATKRCEELRWQDADTRYHTRTLKLVDLPGFEDVGLFTIELNVDTPKIVPGYVEGYTRHQTSPEAYEAPFRQAHQNLMKVIERYNHWSKQVGILENMRSAIVAAREAVARAGRDGEVAFAMLAQQARQEHSASKALADMQTAARLTILDTYEAEIAKKRADYESALGEIQTKINKSIDEVRKDAWRLETMRVLDAAKLGLQAYTILSELTATKNAAVQPEPQTKTPVPERKPTGGSPQTSTNSVAPPSHSSDVRTVVNFVRKTLATSPQTALAAIRKAGRDAPLTRHELDVRTSISLLSQHTAPTHADILVDNDNRPLTDRIRSLFPGGPSTPSWRALAIEAIRPTPLGDGTFDSLETRTKMFRELLDRLDQFQRARNPSP